MFCKPSAADAATSGAVSYVSFRHAPRFIRADRTRPPEEPDSRVAPSGPFRDVSRPAEREEERRARRMRRTRSWLLARILQSETLLHLRVPTSSGRNTEASTRKRRI